MKSNTNPINKPTYIMSGDFVRGTPRKSRQRKWSVHKALQDMYGKGNSRERIRKLNTVSNVTAEPRSKLCNVHTTVTEETYVSFCLTRRKIRNNREDELWTQELLIHQSRKYRSWRRATEDNTREHLGKVWPCHSPEGGKKSLF